MASAALLLGACSNPQSAPDVRLVVDTVAQRYVDQTPILGLTVAVSRNGHVMHERAYGLASRAPDRAAEHDTPFELFSVGKVFTATLALRLAERGVLELDSGVATYVPEVPAPYAGSTVRQLLRHGSGIMENPIDEVNPVPGVRVPASHQAMMAYVRGGQRMAEPDRLWLYNNQGFVLAGLAAEEAAGASYADLVRDELAEPLGLDRLRYCPEVDGIRAAGYWVQSGSPRNITPVDFSWFGGAGSLCGTAGAVARWWTGVRTGRVLDAASIAEMMAPVPLLHGDDRASFGYGLGVRLGEYFGHRLVGHTGNGAGGTAVLAEYPDDSLVIVVATNTAGEGVPHAAEVGGAIARILLGVDTARAKTVPIPADVLRSARGWYRSPEGEFCITGVDTSLFVTEDGGEPVALRHVGEGRFQRPDAVATEEYFPGWPDDFGWFAYRFHGFPMDLAVRVADRCPE